MGVRNLEARTALRNVDDLALLRRKGTFWSNPRIDVTRATGRMATVDRLGCGFRLAAATKFQANETANEVAIPRIHQTWTPLPYSHFAAITQPQADHSNTRIMVSGAIRRPAVRRARSKALYVKLMDLLGETVRLANRNNAHEQNGKRLLPAWTVSPWFVIADGYGFTINVTLGERLFGGSTFRRWPKRAQVGRE